MTNRFVDAKARQLRLALLAGGIASSPNPALSFDDLPADRKEAWHKLAEAYLTIFAGGIPIA